MVKKHFRELLKESFKSNDTEEWLDIRFTRPVGLAIAIVCGRLGISPNAITLTSILIGAVAGWMFHYTDLWHNVCGVLLLMTANFCDSADGQLARLANKRSLVGRMLDGFAGDVWFFCIYLAIVWRLWDDWQLWGLLFCAVAGFLCHAPQCALADYYRNIHLWFLKGDAGSELDSYAKEQRIYDELKGQGWSAARIFHYFYKGYCRKQERLTPQFQQFFPAYRSADSGRRLPVSELFIEGSRPLMPMTNILTFNTRAIVLYVSALIDIPWLYPLFEIAVLQPLYWYMRGCHEHLCETLKAKI